jgi:glycosyltransferase involved in cell wall biosynthesis
VTLTYNVGLPEAFTARRLQQERAIPWVCCVADFPIVSQSDISGPRRALTSRYAERQRAWLEEAAARIYLSWSLYQDDPGPRKFYLEGGVDALHPAERASNDRSPPAIMFAGSLSAWTGIELLLDALPAITSPCELWVCGRGPLAERVEAAARRDPRIRFFGLVSRDELESLMSRAELFVNPRPSHIEDNRYNFPSKLLDYLSWCRPVVSTMTPGIPPSYLSVLSPVYDESPAGLASVLDKVLRRSPEERRETAERIHTHVRENLLWSAQARRLWEWMNSESLLRAGAAAPRERATG